MALDLAITDEHRLLESALARFLAARGGADATDLWRGLACELELMGIGIPERHGGIGGGDIETAIVMAAFGRALVLDPWLETMIAGRLLARAGDDPALVSGIMAGDVRIAPILPRDFGRRSSITARPAGDAWRLDGSAPLVMGAAAATHLLVAAEAGDGRLSLFVLDPLADGVSRVCRRMIGGGDVADVHLSDARASAGARIGPAGEARPVAEWALDALTAGHCAEVSGLLDRLMEDTLAFARARRQFGTPIGAFQAVRHRLVDMQIEAIKADALIEAAIHALEGDPACRAYAVSAAQVQTARAARLVGEGAVQIHGAMGLTDELPLGHFFKRARALTGLHGGAEPRLRRCASLARG